MLTFTVIEKVVAPAVPLYECSFWLAQSYFIIEIAYRISILRVNRSKQKLQQRKISCKGVSVYYAIVEVMLI